MDLSLNFQTLAKRKAWLRFETQRAMDYSLAAVKLLCVQLKDAIESPSENAMDLRGILFQRAWLQVPPSPLFQFPQITPLSFP